MGESIVNPHE